jgi:hypothetical protein
MSKQQNIKKTWIVGSARVTSTFNAPGNLSIPYGQFVGSVRGRAGSGNVPLATAYNITYTTNYNVAYPIANRPEASRPATAWTTNFNTNYNVAYPIANRPEASRPATAWTTNYNVVYPIANRPETGRPVNAWTTNYNVNYPIANQPQTGSNPPNRFDANRFASFFQRYNFDSGNYSTNTFFPNLFTCPTPFFRASTNLIPGAYTEDLAQYSCTGFGGNPNWTTNYNVDVQVANQPATAFSITYTTNYNVAYPIANQPATAFTILYNTNYNIAYPIANQPVANQPATAFTILYNTNYNIAYPIANQPETGRPINAYVPGNPGTSVNLLGVNFPGGPVDLSQFGGNPGTATTVNKTIVQYDNWPTNNLTVPVPPGGQIITEFE